MIGLFGAMGGVLAAPVASFPLDTSAALAPAAWIVAGLLLASAVGIVAAAARRPPEAAGPHVISIEEEERYLRQAA